jgi:hypothetical protein
LKDREGGSRVMSGDAVNAVLEMLDSIDGQVGEILSAIN